MRILIYEIVHLDWVIPYAKLLADENYRVTFYVASSFEKDLKEALGETFFKYTWIYERPAISNYTFHQSFNKVLSKSLWDFIILNTVDSRHLLIYFLLKKVSNTKVLLNVHAINNFFKPTINLNIRINIRTIGKKLLKRKIDGYIVNAYEMKMYLEKNCLTEKPVFWLPPVIYNPLPAPQQSTNSTFTILIPGTIDVRRRNYDLVLTIMHEYQLEGQNPIKFIFAGKPHDIYGSEIIAKCKELAVMGFDIVYFEEEIPEVLFQKLVSEADVILSPLKSQISIHDNIEETYGITQGSGNIYDAIRHAKPFILPFLVQKVEAIKSSCLTYQTKTELKEVLNMLFLNKQKLSYYHQNAVENSLGFTKEKIKERLSNLFSSI